MVKKAIEKTERIQKELVATYPEVSGTHKAVNYIDPPVQTNKNKILIFISQLFSQNMKVLYRIDSQ